MADRELAKTAQRLAAGGLAVQLVLGGAALAAAILSSSFAALAASAHLLVGILPWAFALLLAQRRAARVQQEEEDQRIAREAESEGRKPLFQRKGEEASAQLESRIGAVLGLVLALAEGAVAVALIVRGQNRPEAPLTHLLPGAAVFAASAFALLLLAKYSLAFPIDLTAAGARRAASGALVALVTAILLATLDLAPKLDLELAGYAIAAIEALLALELLLGLVLELYRPRRRGDLPRPGYESKLLGLLAEPTGVARSLARAIDYQFGFKLSETWVYALVEKGIAPLVLFVALAFWLLSAFVVVPQGEVAWLERWGEKRELLEAGLHVKLPWPIDATEEVAVTRVRTTYLGAEEHDDEDPTTPHRAALWTRSHADDEYLILIARGDGETPGGRAVSVDVLCARVALCYFIVDPKPWVLGLAAPEALLKAIGERELAKLGCSRSLEKILGPERGRCVTELQDEIQRAADAAGLGVKVVDVGIEDVHPTHEVAASFHLESAAVQDKEARRQDALAEAAASRLNGAREARAIRERARIDADRKKAVALAAAADFEAQVGLERAGPHVFRDLARLRALSLGLALGGRRVVIPGDGKIYVDLSEKITEGLMEEEKK